MLPGKAFRAGFRQWTDQTGHLFRSEALSEFFCFHLHQLLRTMTLLPHLACVALKRKPESRGKKAPRVPSIVGSFSPQPWLESAGDSVALDVCHLVLVAAQASPAARHGGAHSDSTRATTPDGPAAVEPVGTWPRSVVRALPRHDGPSVEPVRSKRCSTVRRNPFPARRL